MAFWGVEVKPGRPYTHPSGDNARGRLHVSQATLGAGTETNGVVFLQCNVGGKSPVYLCALSWEKVISCPVNVEFEEDDDVVFSVVGPRSVHLSGYYCLPSGDPEPPGEDIGNSEAEQSVEGSEEDEYEDSFIDDSEAEVFSPSAVSSDEEYLTDVVKARNGKASQKRLKKKHQTRESNDSPVPQTNVNRGARAILSDSDNDDKRPISYLFKTKPCKNSTRSHDDTASDKILSDTRKAELKDDANRIATVDGCCSMDTGDKLPELVLPPNGQVSADKPLSKKKRKKSDNKSQQGKTKAEIELMQSVLQTGVQKGTDNGMPDGNPDHSDEVKSSEKKKKKKRKIQENIGENKASTETKEHSSVDKESSHLRTLSNGLIIEDVEMGRPDSEVAVSGKRVTIHYAGRVKEEGKQFDLCTDGENLKFRLGKEKVIKGLDIGIEGMRVGDRRRLIIPPSLGYGSEGNGNDVPPDSWLVYDVKLIKVR